MSRKKTLRPLSQNDRELMEERGRYRQSGTNGFLVLFLLILLLIVIYFVGSMLIQQIGANLARSL